jgi:hypothetical protein
MFAGNLNIEDFFYQLSLECCLDGKISSEEIKLMQNIARLLGIDTEKANHIANRAIKAYKANKAQDEKTLNADELYQNLLLQLAADGVLAAKGALTVFQS